MLYCLILQLFLFLSLSASEVACYAYPGANKNVTFLLSTNKSGANLITGSLSAISRKPISWFYWADEVLNPSSNYRNHISYNRLGLTLVSDIPLLYRTHYQYEKLMQVPSKLNKLIFITRNPKELIYRKFLLKADLSENPDMEFIKEFLNGYLRAFEVYEKWCSETRMLVFYEDYISKDDEILLQMFQLMKKSPVYFEDYLNHKQEYLSRLLQSYSNQHVHNNGGVSARGNPKPIFYTINASPDTLKSIDNYLKTRAPYIWKKYLQRFEEIE